jgi:hypothetical protein
MKGGDDQRPTTTGHGWVARPGESANAREGDVSSGGRCLRSIDRITTLTVGGKMLFFSKITKKRLIGLRVARELGIRPPKAEGVYRCRWWREVLPE